MAELQELMQACRTKECRPLARFGCFRLPQIMYPTNDDFVGGMVEIYVVAENSPSKSVIWNGCRDFIANSHSLG